MLSIDKELLAPLQSLAAATPPAPAVGDWQTRRTMIDALYEGIASTASEHEVERVDCTVTSIDGHAVPARLFKPLTTPNAFVVYLHGGGLIAGSMDSYDHLCSRYAAEAGVAVIAVDYRLAPEAAYPAAVEDCIAAVQWAIHHVEDRVPGARVAVMGDSAGGGLAAATAIGCRDRGIGPLAAQILIYPMLDYRTDQASVFIEPFLTWSAADNVTGWRAYLGEDHPGEVAALASPAQADSLQDLPAAYLEVGQLDLFSAETTAYAARLMQDGVAVELAVRPGAVHGFDQLAPNSRLAQDAFGQRIAFLQNL
jgi:acetyl esterase/lipase